MEAKTKQLEIAANAYSWVPDVEEAKKTITLSVTDRNRLNELTDFYRHLNMVVENMIDKFGRIEKQISKLEYGSYR